MTPKKHADRPKTLKVSNHYYTVDWLTHNEWASRHDEPSNGCTLSDKQLIEIRLHDGVGESHYQQVLLHEVLHAVLNASGLAIMPEGFDGDDEVVEERIVVTTAPVLLGVFQDNPHLVAYLMSPGQVRR